MHKNQKGSLVIEASIILPIIAISVGMLLYMAFLVYQKMQVTVVANDAASSIARVYSNELKDPFIGYVSNKDFYHKNLYRNFDSELKRKAQSKAEWFAIYNLNKKKLISPSDSKVKAKIETKPDKLMIKRVKVTINETYKVPLIGFFGIDNEIKFKSTAYADCDDFIDYNNMTTFAWEKIDELTKVITDNEIIKAIQDVLAMLRGD